MVENPDLFQQALAFHHQNEIKEAENLYREILSFHPRHLGSLYYLGIICHQKRQLNEALGLFNQALEIDPNFPEALNNKANILFEIGTFDQATGHSLSDNNRKLLTQAVECYTESLKLRPDYIEALNNRGNAYKELNELENAQTDYENVLKLNPNHFETLNNFGNLLIELENLDEALEKYSKAIEINPDFIQALNNRGNLLIELQHLDEAYLDFEKILKIDPDYQEAHNNLAVYYLLKGDFKNGWKEYESRWLIEPQKSSRAFTQPLWLGKESLYDKTILIHWEGGFGDAIQFCRYVPLLYQKGAQVIFWVRESPLVRLLSNLPARIVTEGQVGGDFDFHCPLMSLPLAFNGFIPNKVPYLSVDLELIKKWKEKLADLSGLKVGLCWAGSNNLSRDKQRSIPLERFSEILKIDQINFVSLQVQRNGGDPGAARLALRAVASNLEEKLNDFTIEMDSSSFEQEGSGRTPNKENLKIYDWTNEINDFTDTAALIQNLDLVISVDTSVAHLAGALNKPVWLLNRFNTDSRWLSDRTDSVWYPSMRIFRQKSWGNWETVLKEVEEELRKLD